MSKACEFFISSVSFPFSLISILCCHCWDQYTPAFSQSLTGAILAGTILFAINVVIALAFLPVELVEAKAVLVPLPTPLRRWIPTRYSSSASTLVLEFSFFASPCPAAFASRSR